MDEVPHNPDVPPETSCSSSSPGRFDVVAFVTWPIVLGLNLVLPLLFGLGLTDEHGRLGMVIGLLVLLTFGWTLCAANPSWARKLNAGAIVVAVSQVFPTLQIVIGMFALSMGVSLKLVVIDDSDRASAASEAGGFVVTILFGCGLLFFSGIAGLCLGFILPKRWFQPPEPATSSPEEAEGLRSED